LKLIAVSRNFCVGGQNLKPPHCIAVEVGKVEPADYVGAGFDFCGSDIVLSQSLAFAVQVSDFEQDCPTRRFHFSFHDLHPSTADLEFDIHRDLNPFGGSFCSQPVLSDTNC